VIGDVLLKLLIKRLAVAMVNKTVVIYRGGGLSGLGITSENHRGR
jgi:hypothetical protein